MKTKYPKLVRDNIPEIIKDNGEKARITALKNDNYFDFFLKKKLREETTELINAKNDEERLEEAADLVEVVETFLKFHEIGDMDTLNEARDRKNAIKGKFDKRFIMETCETKKTPALKPQK